MKFFEYNKKILISEIMGKGSLRIKMRGGSMFPYLRNGDIAYVKKISVEELKIGDVICFFKNEKLIAHRILKKGFKNGKNFFICKGDAMKDKDEIISVKNYFGKVIKIYRNNKEIYLNSLKRKIMNFFIPKIYYTTYYLFTLLKILKKLLKY